MMFFSTSDTPGGRKSWVRTMATASPKIEPSPTPRTELYNVPQMAGSRPNCSRPAFHPEPLRAPAPYFCTAGAAVEPIS